MPVATIIQLITQVGLPLALELIKEFEKNPTAPWTAAQILGLSAKWGSMSADDYLAQAKAA